MDGPGFVRDLVRVDRGVKLRSLFGIVYFPLVVGDFAVSMVGRGHGRRGFAGLPRRYHPTWAG